MPVGSVVVKEKYVGSNPMNACALMIKREPGYDPSHGDWQYVYVDTRNKSTANEGRLSHCIQCHQEAKESEYLFKFYMKEPTDAP